MRRLRKEVPIPETVDVSEFIKYIKPNEDNKEDYTDEEKCKECKGNCCMSMGCYLSPDDLVSIHKDTIKGLIASGFVSIDWWEGLEVEQDNYYGPGYYLRMRNVDSDVVDPADGCCRCTALTTSGCSLDFKYRPKGGRRLTPDVCHNFRDIDPEDDRYYPKFRCVMQWYPYIQLLEELANEY